MSSDMFYNAFLYSAMTEVRHWVINSFITAFKTVILALNKWNDRLGFWNLHNVSWFEKNRIPASCPLKTCCLLCKKRFAWRIPIRPGRIKDPHENQLRLMCRTYSLKIVIQRNPLRNIDCDFKNACRYLKCKLDFFCYPCGHITDIFLFIGKTHLTKSLLS